MGHLNEIHEKYADKGITLLAVSRQDRSAIDTFIEELDVTHPIVIAKDSVFRGFGVTSYPTCIILGPNGRIVWRDHPASLTDEKLEELLEGVRLLPEMEGRLAATGKSIRKSKFADARKKAEKVLNSSSASEEDKAVAQEVIDWIDWYAESAFEGAGQDLEKGNAYAAWRAYDELQDLFKGSDVAKRAKALAKEVTSDPDNKREVDAGKKLDKIVAELGDLSPNKAIKQLQPIVDKYEGTKAAERAAELIEEIERSKG